MKGTENETDNVKMPMQRSMLWHHLEHSAQFWSLSQKKDIVNCSKEEDNQHEQEVGALFQ